VLLNVRVPRKPPLENFPAIRDRVAQAQATIGDGARILLRYSGTENLARVMIEGRDAALIEREANAIADAIRESIV
jgi:phosphoglucosamine mutase